jgi:uncharacterized protein (DUF433 family)
MNVMETTTVQSQSQVTGSTSDPPPDRVRIVSTPGTCGGRPRIDGHRITVEDVVIWHERMGMSADEIVSAYPSITLSDVHGALAYYFENRQRIDADIEEGKKFADEMRAKAGPSRLQEMLKAREAHGANDPLPSR